MTDSQVPPAVLEQRLGVPLDAKLLERALTHRSFSYENGNVPTNERLEFLGDSVLGLVVTSTLYGKPVRKAAICDTFQLRVSARPRRVPETDGTFHHE